MRTDPVGDGVLQWSAAEQMPLGYDVPFCTVPVLLCRSGCLRPPWMTAAPCRAGPMCPAVPSAPRCHSASVTVSLARESVSSGWGRTDCRVASLLAMTECVGDGVLQWSAAEQMPLGYDVPFCAVPVLPCRGGRPCPPRVTGSGIRPSAYGCMAAAVAGSR